MSEWRNLADCKRGMVGGLKTEAQLPDFGQTLQTTRNLFALFFSRHILHVYFVICLHVMISVKSMMCRHILHLCS